MNKEKLAINPTPLSCQQFMHLMDVLPSALLFIDYNGVILYANSAAAIYAGTAPHELCGNRLWQSAPKLVTTALYQAVNKAIRTLQPFEIKYRSPVNQRWLCVHLSPTGEGLALMFREEGELAPPLDASSRNDQMYRDILESTSDAIIILTPEGLVLDLNKRPLSNAQFKREEAIGKLYFEFPTWSYDPSVQKQLRTAIEQARRGEIARFESRIRAKDGRYIDVWMMITSHRDANQEVEYLICAGRDITVRKHAEDEQRALIDAIPHFIWMMRPDGSAEYMSQSWCDFGGVTCEQMEGDGWLECLHPDDRAHVREVWKAAIQVSATYEVEYRVREGRTGEYRWFLARGVPLYDEQGVIQRWLGTCTDINKQKQAEQLLKASKEQLRQSQERVNVLMNSSIIGTFISENGQVLEANDTYLRMIGYSREELQAGDIRCHKMVPPGNTDLVPEIFKAISIQNREISFEYDYLCKDGSILHALMGVVALQLDPLQVIGFVLDDSARKELERRKDDFISVAGHELKTPLTALKLQTQLMKARLARQGLYAAAADLVRVEAPIKRLERLIGELLDVSKIQAGWLEYVQETVELDVLLRDLITTMQQVYPNYTFVLHEPLPSLSLFGDRVRLEQVFANLINNAIRYSPNARLIEFDVTASIDDVTVGVRDHGIGISHEQSKKIFERFYRGADPHQRMVPGLGMGLYIAAEIVKYHGGTITVESNVGKGSIFQVTLPLKEN